MELGCSKQIAMRKKTRNKDDTVCYIVELGNNPGFLNIDINNKTIKGTFYANESELPHYHYVNYQNNIIIDHFTISKTGTPNNNNN